MEVKKGPWTPEEDSTLFNYINQHGEGHWNSVARATGLKRTGKSCRLRWLNYLRPNVRRGNITLQEQLLILELHSRWGNRWAKIAQFLPGRTDNEIKNYWRTRVQKQAKQLKCDVNSQRFRDAMRFVWIPRLLERIQATSHSQTADSSHSVPAHLDSLADLTVPTVSSTSTPSESRWANPNIPPDVPATSSDSSDVQNGSYMDTTAAEVDGLHQYGSGTWASGSGWNEGCYSDMQDFGAGWLDGMDSSLERLWTEENICFLQQQLFD